MIAYAEFGQPHAAAHLTWCGQVRPGTLRQRKVRAISRKNGKQRRSAR